MDGDIDTFENSADVNNRAAFTTLFVDIDEIVRAYSTLSFAASVNSTNWYSFKTLNQIQYKQSY